MQADEGTGGRAERGGAAPRGGEEASPRAAAPRGAVDVEAGHLDRDHPGDVPCRPAGRARPATGLRGPARPRGSGPTPPARLSFFPFFSFPSSFWGAKKRKRKAETRGRKRAQPGGKRGETGRPPEGNRPSDTLQPLCHTRFVAEICRFDSDELSMLHTARRKPATAVPSADPLLPPSLHPLPCDPKRGWGRRGGAKEGRRRAEPKDCARRRLLDTDRLGL